MISFDGTDTIICPVKAISLYMLQGVRVYAYVFGPNRM